MNRFVENLIKLQRPVFLSFVTFITLLLCIIGGLTDNFFILQNNSAIINLTIWQQILVALFISSILDTFIGQYLPVTIAYFAYKKMASEAIIILICSIVFSPLHAQSIISFVFSFIIGGVFGATYLVSKKRNENEFINLIVIHAICNVFIILTNI